MSRGPLQRIKRWSHKFQDREFEVIIVIRRRFLQFMAISGAGALAFEAKGAAAARTLICQVKGFTCTTCAVGLDTLLSKQKGILSSKSTYPEGKVTIKFDETAITEKAIEGFIPEMGFSVASKATAE
jgi:Cu+-exporting ATPase